MRKIGVFICGLLIAAGMAMLSPASAKAYEENGFYYEVDDKEAVITGRVWQEKLPEELVIPSKIGGFTVTRISSYAFSGASYEEISVPDTVEEIGMGAFARNQKLKRVTLSDNLKEIESDLFYNCSKLTDVEMGNKIKTIGWNAFSNCISLKKISLPDNVEKIEGGAFGRCYKLSEITLGRKLKEIGNRVFYKDYDLEKIALPEGLKTIGDEAFGKCEGMTKVTFANPKTKLGKQVFKNCKSLVRLSLPGQLKTIPEATFYQCTKLEKVNIPKTVSIIKKNTFWGCSSLKNFRLNKNIYAIGDQVFAQSGLRKITLNEKLQFVGNGAFRGTKLEKLKFHNKVTYIGNRLFADCRKLKTISIPASVKGINPGAFNNCISLREINVAEGNKNYSSQNGVLYNKEKTRLIQYPLHKTNASFHAPGTLKNIRANAFSENRYLKSAVISAKTIGRYAFANMSKLQSVIIRNGAVRIGDGAFRGNTKMTKVVLPDSVVKIGAEAFLNTNLRTVHISSRLKELGIDAFLGCHKLAAFEGGKSPSYSVKDGVLYNRKKTELIKYPAQKSDKQFVVPNSVKRIRSEAFDHTAKLMKLEIGTKLEKLDFHSVYKAKRLKSVTFNTRKLSNGASYGSIQECDRLAVIVGPNDYVMRELAYGANATLITL